MYIVSKSIKLIRKAAAVMLLPLLAWSCQLVTDDYDCENDILGTANKYINVTISVSASNTPYTRANTPKGGENGDGRELGIETRENEVAGVTLIFFQHTDGINASASEAASTKIDYAVYYTVTRDDAYIPTTGSHIPGEIYYTTGERELGDNLDLKKAYHMLVVANANLTGQITAGTTTLAEVRDMTLSSVYSGTGIGLSASDFVMSSEKDLVIDYSYSTYDKTTNRHTYYLDNAHLERMAARIDYSAEGATYSTSYDHYGYVYNITGTNDHFVLTSITPFNLNIGDGNEYLFKRTDDATSPYLADETTTNWVLDPYRSGKTTAEHPSWMASTLTAVESSISNTYNITMAASQSVKLDIDGNDVIVLAYPKENTLLTTSPLYYYATGLAFEGYYYSDGATTGGEKRVYYHYLRHQGDKESYDAYKSPIDKTVTCGSAAAMNYGVVRNNIYRVSIGSINEEKGTITIKIEEEKWRHVDNPVIYI